ncbi:MAG: VWA domain-containing protein [Pseudomonadota bacterium]
MFKPLKLSTAAVILALISSSVQAETNIFVVLDGSNSMWGQIDGKAKIETALGALYDTVEEFPSTAKAGLIAYGHREEKNCQDVETLLPLSPLNKQSFITSTENFTPKGKTPIAESLLFTAKQFPQPDANNNVVLISDGIETCGGDPCAAVKRLREEEGLNVDVHVIGFDVDDKAQEQLKCIAEAGNGKYITASDNEGLGEAFTEVAETVKVREEEFIAKQKPENTKTIETEKVIFETSFDEPLSETDWVIAEEKSQFYSVSDGKLSIANDKDMENIFMLNKDLPEGDWQATIKFSLKSQTGSESFKLGLYQDKDNFIFANTYLREPHDIFIRFNSKFDGDKNDTGFSKVIEFNCHDKEKYPVYLDCHHNHLAFNDFLKDNIGELKLVKEGQVLKAFVRYEYEFAKDWISAGDFPLFKPFGKIAFGFNTGERDISTGHFEHIKVESLNISKE